MTAYAPEWTDKIVATVEEKLGPPDRWTKWPGGWPDEISTALIDAVFSARAVYETVHGKGVLPMLKRWQANSTAQDSLAELVAEIDAAGAADWAKVFGSSSHSPGRSSRRPEDPTKAGAVREAAKALVDVAVVRAEDARDKSDLVHCQVQTVPGIGHVTADYFLMLLGVPGVKADRMVLRFVEGATNMKLSTKSAASEVRAAAAALDVSPTDLEHAIWAWQRKV